MKHQLKHLVTPINTKQKSFHGIFKLLKYRKFSHLNKDTILINMYDSPETSSYKKKLVDAGQYEETLENLDNFLTFQKKDNLLMIYGDFNARTSGATSISGNLTCIIY